MRRIAPVVVFVWLALLLGTSRVTAVSSYQTAFNTSYPTSTTGTTTWNSTSARCNVCHSSGGGTDLNAYGAAWALRHNAGRTPAQAFQDLESQNSDGSSVNDLGEITANAQPGWKPGPNNTLYDPFAPDTVTATGQNPPASLIGSPDPAAVNRPPVLTQIPNKTASVGQLLQFQVTATDPDGNTLTFSMANGPTGATLTAGVPGSATFSWTPTASQGGMTYSPSITVTDNGSPAMMAQQTFSITVSSPNRPPVLSAITDQTGVENQLLQFDVTATDPDGNTLRFALANQPTGATLTDNGNGVARFAWTPTFAQSGNYTNVLITVTDSGSPALTAQQAFTITIGDVNRPPVLTPIGARTTSVNQLLQFTIAATDPDGTPLSFTTTNNTATGSTLTDLGNGTATFAWTPGVGQAGNYSVTVSVADAGSPPLSASETFSISVGNVNRPPVLSAIGNRTVNEGQLLTVNMTASDPDGGALSFSATSTPTAAGATFADNHNGTATLAWTPTFAQAGNYSFTVTVTDSGTPPLSASETLTITVGNVNRPPTITAIGNRTVSEGQTLTANISASDPDGGTLILTMTSSPTTTGATFTDNLDGTAAFTWTPSAGQAGSYSVTVTVTDAGTPQLSASTTFTITVQAATANQAPTLTNPGNKTATAGQLLSFTIAASDPDNNAVTIAAVGTLPAGAALSPLGAFSWTPTAAQVSATPYSITVTATDNGTPALTSAPQTFTVTVRAAGTTTGWVRIQEAEWEKSTLDVEGRVSPTRVMVTVENADTGAAIGRVMANAEGKWQLEIPLMSAPCRVRARAGTSVSSVAKVEGAPRCREKSDR